MSLSTARSIPRPALQLGSCDRTHHRELVPQKLPVRCCQPASKNEESYCNLVLAQSCSDSELSQFFRVFRVCDTERLCTHEFFGRRRRRRQVYSGDFVNSPSTEQRRRRRRVRSFAPPAPSTDCSADGQLRKFFECHLLGLIRFNAVDGKPQVCTTLISRPFLMSPSTESSSTDARRKFMCAHPMTLTEDAGSALLDRTADKAHTATSGKRPSFDRTMNRLYLGGKTSSPDVRV
jgi:hypothetical protein